MTEDDPPRRGMMTPIPETVMTHSQMDRERKLVRDLVEEKFKIVEVQMSARDAALRSHKEAHAKSEISFGRQIDRLNTMVTDTVSRHEMEVLMSRVQENAARLDKIEGKSVGTSKSWGYVIALSSIVFAAGSLILALINRLESH